jgi:hypothetical protein
MLLFVVVVVLSRPQPTMAMCRRVLEGLPMILKYIARAAAPGTLSLYGNSALDSCMIDEWMDFCNSHFVSGPGLQAAVASAGACFRCICYSGAYVAEHQASSQTVTKHATVLCRHSCTCSHKPRYMNVRAALHIRVSDTRSLLI